VPHSRRNPHGDSGKRCYMNNNLVLARLERHADLLFTICERSAKELKLRPR